MEKIDNLVPRASLRKGEERPNPTSPPPPTPPRHFLGKRPGDEVEKLTLGSWIKIPARFLQDPLLSSRDTFP